MPHEARYQRIPAGSRSHCNEGRGTAIISRYVFLDFERASGGCGMIFNRLLGLFSHDLAIDLGTATTLVYVKGEGIICSEPRPWGPPGHPGTKKVLAVGIEAKRMIGRTPREHRGDPSHQGRRHRRFRGHRGDAPLLHPEGPQGAHPRASPASSSAFPTAAPRSSGAPSASPRKAAAPGRCISSRNRWRPRSGRGLPSPNRPAT